MSSKFETSQAAQADSEENTENEIEEKCEIIRQRIIEKCEKQLDLRQRRIILIGPPGAGKSSFVNSIAAAMSKSFSMVAEAGSFGDSRGDAESGITLYLSDFLNLGLEESKFDDLPTLIDLTGLPNNERLDLLQEVLSIVIYGRLPENERVQALFDFVYREGNGVKDLRLKYPETRESRDLEATCIVFVLNADSDNVPESLMKAVTTVVMNGPRQIRIFGLITKKDLAENEEGYPRLREALVSNLGLVGVTNQRLGEVKCYCDANCQPPRQPWHYPALDLPILEFLELLLDPANRAIDRQKPSGRRLRKPPMSWNGKMCLLSIFIALVAVILFAVFSNPSKHPTGNKGNNSGF
ncbi:uncharacterized protein LOC106158517 [Lingula anatina]|uniref:Uncharacterized protein LOC106158517 n=1 Tax=Lingula anatina TaxID=7574 RepID=A0A1S3HVE7_LINAN|nr:uncharacterized protein LOC106158517 [Lingula anatina]|eukprot:XP_013389998.1 uncharacterized protein LOC106158517 [Lingula anatina]